MTTENVLINKTYYQSLLDDNKQSHPIKLLGDKFREEMRTEQPDLSSIRYAQGEVYFMNGDYEAAVHKWQFPLEPSLVPWAQKNIADAHMEMGILDLAEKFYHEVKTESLVLKSEVLLQLFSLYIQQDESNKAVNTIKEAVQLHPDYGRITEIAQTYFEDIQDWDSAIELAVNEAIRTQAFSWFEILQGYAEHGLTTNIDPTYFKDCLKTVIQLDPKRFESLLEVFWKSYRGSTNYIEWLSVCNEILLETLPDQTFTWEKLPQLFADTFFELISGRFLIREIRDVMNSHVRNWLTLSSANALSVSSAILAWDEIFPAELDANLIKEAEQLYAQSPAAHNGREEGLLIYEAIKVWAEKEGLLERLIEYMAPIIDHEVITQANPTTIRNMIKEAISFLMEQKRELLVSIKQDIQWNEERQTEIIDMEQQIRDMEKEKATTMITSFQEFKEKLKENMTSKIPKIIRYCSELVQEDSDFTKLHVELNTEMNKRLNQYLGKTVMYEYDRYRKQWLESCENEWRDSQETIDQLALQMNETFGEERVKLKGDFKVLEDWQRDLDRMSRGLILREEVNIMLRKNASQLLLKGAGKILGSITKNKDMLYTRYKNYIENGDYSDIAEEIIRPFLQQMESFEDSIEWDVNRFFTNSYDVLNVVNEEVQDEIGKLQHTLTTLLEKPEIYRDPLTLFELRLHHYELMNRIS
ncbi:tetratricopeptide repeat protein [Ornithinibacillus halotolerans]|uniref:Tetratricopeptide repeat protein n=1 Tax=Ornithinibacillus halotolerans TaxID=1274357 RepID=A0A916RL12_9BACI|nr:hypothetical protein [Ornithinibacillus halotolerans]GGA60617.1 hypothetical protein GCM10008025_00810 [Ornithinibacillus halotolerans]